MSRSWKVIKGGEYPIVEFTETCKGIECDCCHRIVPENYVEWGYMARNGHHDGRDGKYAYCKDVFSSSGGMAHRKCF